MLHLVGFLLTVNYDARNRELKTPFVLCRQNIDMSNVKPDGT